MKLVRVKRKDADGSEQLFNAYKKSMPEHKKMCDMVESYKAKLGELIFDRGDFANGSEQQKRVWKSLRMAWDRMDSATFNLKDAWHMINGMK